LHHPNNFSNSPLAKKGVVYGEVLAARLAISLARSLNLEKFIIESDSQVVILSLQNSQNSLDWRISSIIYDITDSFRVSISWSPRKINRSVNFCNYSVTHWVGAKSFSGRILSSHYSSSPPGLCSYCKWKDLATSCSVVKLLVSSLY
jgi:hypothetical protein